MRCAGAAKMTPAPFRLNVNERDYSVAAAL